MGLLDSGKLTKIVFNAINKPLLYAVTLHKRGAGYDANGVPNGAEADTPLRGCVLEFSAFRRQSSSIPDTDMQVIVSQHLAAATPETGDYVTARGVRYHVVTVMPDPANATWVIHGRPE